MERNVVSVFVTVSSESLLSVLETKIALYGLFSNRIMRQDVEEKKLTTLASPPKKYRDPVKFDKMFW